VGGECKGIGVAIAKQERGRMPTASASLSAMRTCIVGRMLQNALGMGLPGRGGSQALAVVLQKKLLPAETTMHTGAEIVQHAGAGMRDVEMFVVK
jgi:hypothetical protein